MIGLLLVVLTWLVLLAGVLALGAPGARLATENRIQGARLAIWVGLLLLIMIALTATLFSPLNAAPVAWVTVVVILGSAGVGWLVWRRTPREHTNSRPPWLLTVLAMLSPTYFAYAALGAATNYDTGLYHAGAVRYAFEYGLIPGLANLFDPYGYNNALFPFAALLGNGLWQLEGFRLANGFIIALLFIDVLLRWRSNQHTVGAYVGLVGLLIASVPLIAMADYWVTSPTSDTAVFILSIASFAALSDVVARSGNPKVNASIAVLTMLMAAAMRPLMWLALAMVIAIVVWRLRSASRRISLPLAAAVLAVLIVQSLRDRVLSGWLQYPLAYVSFDVPWLASDPIESQLATLASARDPIGRENARSGYEWIGAWIERLPFQWEPYFLALLFLTTAALSLIHRKTVSWSQVLLTSTPAIALTIVWFLLTPPSFRFAWGIVFALAFIPLGWILSSMRKQHSIRLVNAASLTVFAILMFSALFRLDHPQGGSTDWSFGPIRFNVVYTPLPEIPTREEISTSGVAIQVPIPSDQCWATFPMCSPAPEAALSYFEPGQGFQSGLTAGLTNDE